MGVSYVSDLVSDEISQFNGQKMKESTKTQFHSFHTSRVMRAVFYTVMLYYINDILNPITSTVSRNINLATCDWHSLYWWLLAGGWENAGFSTITNFPIYVLCIFVKLFIWSHVKCHTSSETVYVIRALFPWAQNTRASRLSNRVLM